MAHMGRGGILKRRCNQTPRLSSPCLRKQESLLKKRASADSSFTVSSAAPSAAGYNYEDECDKHLENGQEGEDDLIDLTANHHKREDQHRPSRPDRRRTQPVLAEEERKFVDPFVNDLVLLEEDSFSAAPNRQQHQTRPPPAPARHHKPIPAPSSSAPRSKSAPSEDSSSLNRRRKEEVEEQLEEFCRADSVNQERKASAQEFKGEKDSTDEDLKQVLHRNETGKEKSN